jgi:hypothetical protein
MRPSKMTVALVVIIVVGVGGTYGAFLYASDPADEESVATLGTETVIYEGSVEANVSETLADLATMRGYEAPTPSRVEVQPFTTEPAALRRFRVLGLQSAFYPSQLAFRWRIAGQSDSVIEITNDLPPEVQAVAIAGAAELIHQDRLGLSATDPAVRTDRFYDYDAAWAARLVRKGAATYVEQAMWDRRGRPGAEPIRFYRTVGDRSPAAHRASAPQRLGYDWVTSQVSTPTDLDAVYDDPPTRTAEILHPEQNRSYPTMRIESESGAWEADQRVRLGELGTRFILETQVSHDRASAVADGWVDDRLIEYLGGQDEQGFVWVVRLRNPSESEAFTAGLDAYVDGRADPTGTTSWRGESRSYEVLRPNSTTVALVLGPSTFVDATSVTVEENVTITT